MFPESGPVIIEQTGNPAAVPAFTEIDGKFIFPLAEQRR
jgi:hypothetical protein